MIDKTPCMRGVGGGGHSSLKEKHLCVCVRERPRRRNLNTWRAAPSPKDGSVSDHTPQTLLNVSTTQRSVSELLSTERGGGCPRGGGFRHKHKGGSSVGAKTTSNDITVAFSTLYIEYLSFLSIKLHLQFCICIPIQGLCPQWVLQRLKPNETFWYMEDFTFVSPLLPLHR